MEISATHTRKYNQLKRNNDSSSNLVNKDQWGKNILKRTLSPAEIAALMKGFNFAITPKNVPVSKILSSIETGYTNGYGLPFLDTITSRRGTAVEVEVYRKPTHTDRYLDFHSHHPWCHKRSVVNTLLLRARNIPSTGEGKLEETQRAKAVLRENNYPSGFIKECERALATKSAKPTTNGFVVVPYVKGVSERIGRVLKQQNLQVSYKPQRTINSLSPRPKQQEETDRPSSGVVYRINCSRSV